MGESVADAANRGDKMAPSNPVLEVSVSFGRFENDSLSWERWSSFSPNKYLEEVEKCATPGSVAQKKAYFEEHYKKIAARKAELFSQEKPMESKPLKSEAQTDVDLTVNTSGPDSGFGISNSQHTGGEVHQATNLVSVSDETHVDQPSEEAAIVEEFQSLLLEGVKEEVEKGPDSLQVREPEETVPEQPLTEKEEKTPPVGAKDINDSSVDTKRERKIATQLKVKMAKPDHPVKSGKFAAVAKESNASAVRRKSVSPTSKVTQFSTPRASKPTPTPSMKSASSTTMKIGSNLVAKVKNPSTVGSRKVASKSVHMSLNLASPSPDSAPIRKSFIMENMGDKEIVRRAFKTFQNNYSLQKSSGDDGPTEPKQVSSRATETRISSVAPPRKENGGSLRVGGGEKKNAKAAPSSFGIKSDERAEKRKEFSKKSEKQGNHSDPERTRIPTKSKHIGTIKCLAQEGRELDMRKLRQSHNYKATPIPGFFHGQVPKNSADKTGNRAGINPSIPE